jgi:hypothetical protein
MAKYKITPLARFLIFMVIAAPLLYLLSTYITGEESSLKWPWGQEDTAIEVNDSADVKEAVSKGIATEDSLADDTVLKKTMPDSLDSSKAEQSKPMNLRDSLELLKLQLDSCRKN